MMSAVSKIREKDKSIQDMKEREIILAAQYNYVVVNFNKHREKLYKETQETQEKLVKGIKDSKESVVKKVLFPEENFLWNDLDPRFPYFLKDVPVLDLREEFTVKVVNMKSIDEVRCELIAPEGKYFRTILDEGLTEYCESTKYNPAFKPHIGELCFVKVPSYNELDALMECFVGVNWKPVRNLKKRCRYGDSNAGKWMRAEIRNFMKNKTIDDRENAVQVFLVDFGRIVPVRLKNTRPAIFRFVSMPALCLNVMIALEKPVQYTSDLSLKWIDILQVGTELKLRLVGMCNSQYLARLIKPSEGKFLMDYNWTALEKSKGQPIFDETAPITTPTILAGSTVELGDHYLFEDYL